MGIEIKDFFWGGGEGAETQEKSTVEKKNCQMQKIAHTQSESFFFSLQAWDKYFLFSGNFAFAKIFVFTKSKKKKCFFAKQTKKK